MDVTTTPSALEYISEEHGYAQAPVVVYEKDGSKDHWSGMRPDEIIELIELEKAH